MENLDSIKEIFENNEITIFIDNYGEAYFQPIDLAKALAYVRPKVSANDILKTNAEHFKSEIKHFPVSSEPTPEKALFLTEVGMNFFIMCSNQPKAKELQLKLSRRLKEYRMQNLQLTDPLQRGLAISKQLVHVYEQQIAQQNQLVEVQAKVKVLEETTGALAEELYNLSKKQKYKISSRVKEIVISAKEVFPDLSDKKLFSSFYGMLKDNFSVATYDEIPRDRFDEANQFLDCLEKLVLCKQIDLNYYMASNQVKTLCRQQN